MLFFPDFIPVSPGAESLIPFSLNRELIRMFARNIPAFALVLLLHFRQAKRRGVSLSLRPGRGDVLNMAIALPALLALSALISLLMRFLSPGMALPLIEAPRGAVRWMVLLLSCLSTGYLEEGFFRHYLINLLRWEGMGNSRCIVFTALVFALSHLYEGPWGTANALAAGMILAVLYTRRPSLHGLAWAHGAYNAIVYALGV